MRRPTLEMNRVDARRRGLEDEQEVLVRNERGALRVRLHLTDDVHPGIVALPGKWWTLPEVRGALANEHSPSLGRREASLLTTTPSLKSSPSRTAQPNPGCTWTQVHPLGPYAKVDGREHELGPGEEVLIQPGQVHSFANARPSEPLVFRCTAEPALNLQWFLTEGAESAIRSGGSCKDASLLETAYILHQIPGEYRLAGMPAVLQDLLVGTLAKVATLLGKTIGRALPP
jgi:hypothetical protein